MQKCNKIEKKKMLTLTEKGLKLYEDATLCYICRNKFTQNLAKDKTFVKLGTIVNIEMWHIAFVI